MGRGLPVMAALLLAATTARNSLCADYCAAANSDASCAICGATDVVSIHNAYERRSGRAIGDGLYAAAYLAEVWKPTVFALRSDVAARARAAASRCAFGTYAFAVDANVTTENGTYAYAHRVDVSAKYVRHEIRTLDEGDRERFFAALQVLYATPGAAGRARYGSRYASAAELVRRTSSAPRRRSATTGTTTRAS
ncbi:hypothetical protein JL721_4246 [Aureococcus anophagefferens]|nr:hypothetical protein JL721_4246 [Aureococcus anophagefferens]